MKEFFASNLKLKLLAIIFSMALWFFVAGQSRTEIGFIVPISYKGIPKDFIMTGMPPDEVEVRVTGPRLFINNLSPAQISAELDLSAAKEGVNTLRLQPTDIITPMGVDVQRLRPSSVDFRLEKIIRVELPVRPRLTGRPAPGYRVADVLVYPKTVLATGTRKEIRELKEVQTRPVDISGLDSSASLTAQVDTAGLEFRSLSAEKVEVKILIRKEI